MTTLISEPGKLKTIAAYWNANITEGTDRGFSICLADDLAGTARHISQMVKLFENQPRTEREDFLSGSVYAQLREASRLMWSTLTNGLFNPALLSQHDQALVMVYGLLNIAILEAQGLLVSDDNNGMLYMYAESGRGGKPSVRSRGSNGSKTAIADVPFSSIAMPEGKSPRGGE